MEKLTLFGLLIWVSYIICVLYKSEMFEKFFHIEKIKNSFTRLIALLSTAFLTLFVASCLFVGLGMVADLLGAASIFIGETIFAPVKYFAQIIFK